MSVSGSVAYPSCCQYMQLNHLKDAEKKGSCKTAFVKNMFRRVKSLKDSRRKSLEAVNQKSENNLKAALRLFFRLLVETE